MIDERQLIKDIAEYGARYYQNNGMHNDKVTSTIDHILDEIVAKQPKVNEWISVEKKLPEMTSTYDVCLEVNYCGEECAIYMTALYNIVYKKWYVSDGSYGYIPTDDVIAWKPIEPYIPKE